MREVNYDQEETDISSAYQNTKELLVPQERFYTDEWFEKFQEPVVSPTFKELRNTHALCLLDMIYKGSIEDPFNRRPDDGPLKNYLPSEIKYSFQNKTLSMIIRDNQFKDNMLYSKKQPNPLFHSKVENEMRKHSTFMFQQQFNSQSEFYNVVDNKLVNKQHIYNQMLRTDLSIEEELKEYEKIIKQEKQRISELEDQVQKMENAEEEILEKMLYE